MANYLTHAMILIKTEAWLGELISALERRAAAQRVLHRGLPDIEQRILELARESRRLLRVTPGAPNPQPAVNIGNGVGDGLSKVAFAGTLGLEYPGAGHVLALNRNWPAHTLHNGSPNRAWVDANSTELVLNLILEAAKPAHGLDLSQKQTALSYALGHLAAVASDVILKPALNTWEWSDDNHDGLSRTRFEAQLEARIAQGFFKRGDLHDGQEWPDYYLGAEADLERLAGLLVEAFKETYGGDRPNRPVCVLPEAGRCRAPQLTKAFLVDGYKNTVNWAIDVGYDHRTGWWFEPLIGTLIAAGGALTIWRAWDATITYNAEKWRAGQAFADERLWFDLISNAYSWTNVLIFPFSFLAKSVFPVSLFWDGIFGQGLISTLDRPFLHATTTIVNGLHTFIMLTLTVWDLASPITELQHVGVRWSLFLSGVGLTLLGTLLVDRGSDAEGYEGDRLAYTLYLQVKLGLFATYLISELLVFVINSTNKDESGAVKTDITGWGFLLGLILPSTAFVIGVGSGFFTGHLFEQLGMERWPETETGAVNRYLPIEEQEFTATNAEGFPVSLFSYENGGILETPEHRKYYIEAPAGTAWGDIPARNLALRKEKSRRSAKSDYHMNQLFDDAAHLSGILAMAAVNFNAASSAMRDQTKLIFKDWNLNYLAEEQWDELMREPAHGEIGLLRAVERWLEDLNQNQQSQLTTIARVLEILGERPVVSIKLKSKLLDANPFNPAIAEPLAGVQIHSRVQSVISNETGQFDLETALSMGEQTIEIGQTGMERLVLNVEVTGEARGPITVVIRGSQAAELARVTRDAPVDLSTVINITLPDLRLVVHKIRGTVHWPDSRTLSDQNYHGTRLAGKRVYALPLAEGDINPQRPADTRAWAQWKSRLGVLASGRPGRFPRGERTDQDGAFEIKFIDLTPGKRYFLWVESLDPITNVESPEYCVRTFYRQLIHLTGSVANLTAARGYHLIDYTYNLTRDPIAWGVESLKLVSWTLDTGAVEVRAVRPQREAKAVFETQEAAGERLNFDTARKIVSDYRLKCLPLVPVFETIDRQSDYARLAQSGLLEAVDTRFPRGHFAGEVRFVLDARRIDPAISLQTGAWDGAWDPANLNRSRNRRRCELLEKTFIVSPQIPSVSLPRVEDARWRFDAITLADFALISIPAAPFNQAVAANRGLDSIWIPVLQPALPRLTGLSAGRHLFLAPGHGFFDNNSPSNNPADWRSQRGGYNFMAGEDENDAYMAAEVNRIVQKQGMRVTNVREVADFTAPGVFHPANNAFAPSPNPDFLRLWQQNPMYYLGSQGHAVIVGPGSNLGQLAGNHNDKGIQTRSSLSLQAAGGANPIDIFLAIHTNASNGAARGVSAIFLDVDAAVGNNTLVNTIGQDFATRLRDNLVNQCHISQRPVVSVRQLGNPIADLQRTFDHWTQNQAGTSALWPRVQAAPPAPAGWQHRSFPRAIPAALVEVAFHDNAEDAALLSRAWFRRKAGEAMSNAVEAQLRANPAAVTQADLMRMLQVNFGPTDAILGLPNGNMALTANDLRAAIQTATGEAVNVPAANIDAAVTAIETARSRLTRQTFVEGLRDVLAERAGYDAGSADIGQFVTAAILLGGTLANLSRPNASVSRGEVGSLIATAFGWSPASLDTVIGRQIDGRPLMRPLGGATQPLLYVPSLESQEIFTRLHTIDPLQIYQLVNIFLADEQFNPLSFQDGRSPHFSLRAGQRIRLVVNAQGVPWQVSADRHIQFAISNSSGFRQSLPGDRRTFNRLSSRVWEVNLPANGIYQVAVTITHQTQSDKTLTLTASYDLFQSS